jgi:hypothetical protein
MEKKESKSVFTIIQKGRSHHVSDGNCDIIIDDPKTSRGMFTHDAAVRLNIKNGSFCVFGSDGKNILASKSDSKNKNAYRLNGHNTFQFAATQLKKAVQLGTYRSNGKTEKHDGLVFHVFAPEKLIHQKEIERKKEE